MVLRRRSKFLSASLAAAIGCASLVGCVVNTADPPPRTTGIVVNHPPPAPEREPPPPPSPNAAAVWVPGYWHWNGLQYSWIGGHWEQHAPQGAQWHAPHYSIRGSSYVYEPGGWR